MDRVHPEPYIGTPYGRATTPYGMDPNPPQTVLQQSQPPPYPVPPYSNPTEPKPAWQYPPPPPPQYGFPMVPGPSYSSAYPPPMQPQQQQQQQVVIIGGGVTRAPVRYNVVASYGGQIAVSCLVFWFCNALFGFIAFVLAAVANDVVVLDKKRAENLGRASYIVSGTGVLVTIVTIAIVVGVVVGGAASTTSSSSSSRSGGSTSTCYNYYVNGLCYSYRNYYVSYSQCYATYYGYYNSLDGYCYYNY